MVLSLIAVAAVSGSLTGSVSYRERVALPEDAVLVVSLDRFAKNSQTNVSEVSVKLGGKQVPVRYTLPYFGLNTAEKFGVRASIKVGQKTIFQSPSHTMVQPGAKREYNLVLGKNLAENPWPLADRTWSLISLEGIAISGERPPSLTFQSKQGQFGGFTGVNTFGGTYIWNAPSVQLDPGMQTMMAGSEEAMNLERNFLRVLTIANKLAIEEGELQLYRGDKPVARFKVKKD